MADNDKTPKKDEATSENPKDTRFQKKFPKKIIPDSQPSSDTNEERMEMPAPTVARLSVVDRLILELTGPGLLVSRKADTPRSTDPPMADRLLRRRFCRSSGWFAIRSTSSRSSVDETRLLTKAVSKTGCL